MESIFRRTSPFVVLATLGISFYLYLTQWSELGTIGSFTLHLTDLLFGFIAIFCIGGAMTRRHYSATESLLLMLCGVLVLNFARGVFASSAAASGVQFREFAVFVLLVVFIYFWGSGLNVDWLFNKIITVGWGIVILSFARVFLGLGAFILEPLDPSYEFRTLNGSAALMLGQATLISFHRVLSSRGAHWRRKWGTFLIFAVTLLISQQRTVLFSTIVGLAIFIVSLPERYKAMLITAGSAALVGAGIVFGVVWMELGGDFTEYLPRAVSMIIFGAGTFQWRVEYWQDYLDVYSHASLVDQLIGQPFGVPRLASARNSYLLYSAHSEYVSLLLNSGAIGVLLFASGLSYALARGGALLFTSANDFNRPRNLALAVAIIASHAVYSIGYVLPNEQGLLLAVALQTITRTPLRKKKASLAGLEVNWS